MTEDAGLSRRGAFAMGAAMPLGLGAMPGSARAATQKLDLSTPAARLRVRMKVTASLKPVPQYRFYRLHLYAYMNEGNLVPLFTMNNINVTTATQTGENAYSIVGFESGVYCKFDTDEVLDVWENPITGEKREVWQFIGGPLKVTITADGVDTGEGATVKPKEMRMEQIGDMVFVPSQSAFKFPHPMKREEWPKESSGPTFFWDSHFVYGAKVEDVMNPDLDSAPAFCQFQNLVSWHPWLGLGGKDGRSYGKAYGTKLKSLDDLPPHIVKQFRDKTPEIFDTGNWTEFKDDFKDFMKTRKPT
ncbi:MAG: DUF1838 domain-containing protein [Alphaproteobacteria bacterium]|nr:DUF1838 domain-containing protein [Alphaproteobacteria bacterium]